MQQPIDRSLIFFIDYREKGSRIHLICMSHKVPIIKCTKNVLKMFRKLCLILFISSIIHEGCCSADPCTTHATLTGEIKRSVAYKISANESPLCDSVWTDQWYKVESAAGNDTITSCPLLDSCGTHNPIWMNGTLPDVADGIVDRTACVSNLFDCCDNSWTIQVKNCTTFHVYKLPPSSSCPEAYCFGTLYITTPAPPTTTTTTTTQPTTTSDTTSDVTSQTPSSHHRGSTTQDPHKVKDKQFWIVVVICVTVVVIVLIVSFTIYKISQTIKNRVADGNIKCVTAVKYFPDFMRPKSPPPEYSDSRNQTQSKPSSNLGPTRTSAQVHTISEQHHAHNGENGTCAPRKPSDNNSQTQGTLSMTLITTPEQDYARSGEDTTRIQYRNLSPLSVNALEN